MRHLSLFSGIGGFDLAAEWMGWENVAQVEKDPWCQRVLEKNFPNAKRYGDIKEFDGTQYRGTIDVLSGGPPCQPASNAGKRKGEADDRWKWPEAIRVVGEVGPRVAVFENPDDLLTLADGEPFERICSSLENLSYTVETFGLPAACVGAFHERDRIWIVAHNDNFLHAKGMDNRTHQRKTRIGKGEHKTNRQASFRERVRIEHRADIAPNEEDTERHGPEPKLVGMVPRLPRELDVHKGLGNSIYPEVAYEIFKAIQASIR